MCARLSHRLFNVEHIARPTPCAPELLVAISVVSSALIFISILSDDLSAAIMIPFCPTLTCTVNNKCATSRNPSTGCGIKCSGDFQCSGGVCSRCLNGSCAQPQCGTYCYDNTGCSSGSNGCTSCLSNGNGNSVCSVPSQCGSSCTDNYQCYGNNNGCTTCSSLGQCVQSSIDTACVSTFDDLRSAASGTSDTITLCAGSQITLYEQLTVNRSGSFTLQCVTGGSCTINGNGSYTNIVINAANAVISGITFQNCKSSDNVSDGCYKSISYVFFAYFAHLISYAFISILLQGGAITINAASQQGSRIQSCTFNSNSAVVRIRKILYYRANSKSLIN